MARSIPPYPVVMRSFQPARALISARALVILGSLAAGSGSVFTLVAHAQPAPPRNPAAARTEKGPAANTGTNAATGANGNAVGAATTGTIDASSPAQNVNPLGINVLIVALEPLPPQRETVTPLDNAGAAGAGTPQRTIPRVPTTTMPAIRPASQKMDAALGYPLNAPYVVVAAKREKFPKQDFGLKPEKLPPNYYPDGQPPITPDRGTSPTTGAAGDNAAGGSSAPPANAPADTFTLPPLFSAPSAGGGADNPLGFSQFMAIALRRALTAAGYTDSLDVAPGAPSLLRVINARRLSLQPFTELRSALWSVGQSLNTPAANGVAQTGAAPEIAVPAGAAEGVTQTTAATGAGQSRIAESVLQNAARAAARIGQAMGYRSVVVVSAVPATAPSATGQATVNYTMLVVDALRETCEPIAYDGAGTDAHALEVGASTGAPLVIQQLTTLPAVADGQKAQLAQTYYKTARVRAAAGDTAGAKELAMQSLTLNPALTDASKLLSDLLANTDPAGALEVLRRATEANLSDGEVWGKIAVAQVASATPDWPSAVSSGNRALALGYDTSALRVSLAIAQLSRARLYRDADPPRDEKADAAEASAREHLDHAFLLDPANPEVIRLLADQMIQSEQYDAAARVLDRIASQYPDDIELQKDYALALMQVEGRSEDAFTAWARAWRLAGAEPEAPVDEETYGHLAEGFDRRIDSIGGSASRLSLSVAMGALGHEAARLQMTKLQQDVKQASDALKSLQPPVGSNAADAQESRTLAAALMEQSVKLNRTYLETGQEIYRTRATESHRQAIVYLKLARAGG